jgi:hypothetical protein
MTILALALALLTTPAFATSGWGCWQPVGIPDDDVLNVRAERSASSAIVTTIPPEGGPIISGGVDKLDAEARCLPHSAPSAQRWCPVALYYADQQWRGFVKRRYLRHSECP